MMKTSSASNVKTKEKMDSNEFKNSCIITPDQKDFDLENWSYDLMSENSWASKSSSWLQTYLKQSRQN